MNLEEMRKARFLFLNRLYEVTGGNENARVIMWEVGSELGFEGEATQLITQYLKGEGLIVFKTLGGGIGITHYGVKEVEDALSHPDRPTLYFPPVNIINVQSMVNSNIQQASPAAVQDVDYSEENIASLRTVLGEIESKLGELKLSAEKKEEFAADLASLKGQLASPKPKSGIIRETLKSIRAILDGAAGSLVAAGIQAKLNGLI